MEGEGLPLNSGEAVPLPRGLITYPRKGGWAQEPSAQTWAWFWSQECPTIQGRERPLHASLARLSGLSRPGAQSL